jgi:hypothetical protein
LAKLAATPLPKPNNKQIPLAKLAATPLPKTMSLRSRKTMAKQDPTPTDRQHCTTQHMQTGSPQREQQRPEGEAQMHHVEHHEMQ